MQLYPPLGGGHSSDDHCSAGNQAWNDISQGCPSLPAGVSFYKYIELDPKQHSFSQL